MLLSRIVFAATAVALCSCRPCFVGPWGDGKSAPELEVVARTVSGGSEVLDSDGRQVDLTFPTQGGHVLFLGARVKNLFACNAEISARVLEPDSGHVAAEEKRQVSFAVAAGGGYGMSDVTETSELANVPTCPNVLDRDMVDQTWTLELSVTDADGKSASVTRTIVPACRQPDAAARASCQCECRANYTFGRCANPLDGGTSDAGTRDGG